jgi:hypothetical protein
MREKSPLTFDNSPVSFLVGLETPVARFCPIVDLPSSTFVLMTLRQFPNERMGFGYAKCELGNNQISFIGEELMAITQGVRDLLKYRGRSIVERADFNELFSREGMKYYAYDLTRYSFVEVPDLQIRIGRK